MANLGIIGADPSEPPSHEAVISLANRLLSQFNISTKIESIDDINASVFVVLYEYLFSSRLPGIIRQPKCKEDAIHNCHVVIDVLSTDVVRDNLSHIKAEDIVTGDITAISNLLDIFSYLLQIVTDKIDSDVPTDLEETISLSTAEPDVSDVKLAGSPQGRKALRGTHHKQEKPKVSLATSNKTNNNGSRPAKKAPSAGHSNGKKASNGLDMNENRKVISHEDFCAMINDGLSDSFSNRPLSPIKSDHSQSLLGQKSIDSEFELEKLEKKLQDNKRPVSPKLAWEEKESVKPREVSPQYDLHPPLAASELSGPAVAPAVISTDAVLAPTSSHVTTSSKGRGPTTSLVQGDRPVPAFSASMPASGGRKEKERADPLRSTVGPIGYQSDKSTPERITQDRKKTSAVKGFSSSYDDLRHLVEKTAALTRVALETSPVRSRTHRDLDATDVSEDRPRPYISSEGVKLARELNALGLHGSGREEKQPLLKASKKVAFLASESEASVLDRYRDRKPLGSLSNRDSYRDVLPSSSKDGYSSDGESDLGLQDGDYRARIARSSQPKDSAGAASAEATSSRTTSTKKQSLAKHLARNRQPELGAAHSTVKAEDREMRRKQDILRRMYDEEMEEIREEMKEILQQDGKKSKETYDQYIRRCLEGAPRKQALKKGKASAVPSTHKKRKVASSIKPQRRATSSKSLPGPSKPLVVQSEEELLPMLLEEFPHLHLSEHTWHELWRKGLHQIEALTNSYKASERKKCRAQNQLQEAAERHELLADIMKKQLEHTKRMRDIQQRKQQQVQVKNKLHEQRMQSARARRYYNEYQVRARGKQLKKRTKEELVFRELFKDALQIQKERIKDIRKYASDQRKEQESRRQDEIDSMQNFYQSQFELLLERLSKERMETELRDTAQQQMMERLKRELRKKMESEIKMYQDQILRDEDDAHFRQMDADRIRKQLHLTNFSTKI